MDARVRLDRACTRDVHVNGGHNNHLSFLSLSPSPLPLDAFQIYVRTDKRVNRVPRGWSLRAREGDAESLSCIFIPNCVRAPQSSCWWHGADGAVSEIELVEESCWKDEEVKDLGGGGGGGDMRCREIEENIDYLKYYEG